MTALRACKVTDSVYWVGAIDWELREFHGYATNRGSTYNAYLILGERTTLIDTVKAPFREELLARIASVIDPGAIDTVVSLHSEMDHSGCLPGIIDIVQPERVFASKMGVKALTEHFHLEPGTVTEIADGDSIVLGDRSLHCFDTRMLHWPDSMVAHLDSDRILFSQDGFGMHLASLERFADQLPREVIDYETRKYFANILLPYSRQVERSVNRLLDADLEIDLVAPDHGPIWRGADCGRVMEDYLVWAAQKPTAKALVVHATMWHSTELMAKVIGEALYDAGLEVRILDLSEAHRSELATEVLCAGALVVGSPTMNNDMFPALADGLTYLKGLRPQNLVGAVFGSFGWNGKATEQIDAYLEVMGIPRVSEPVTARYVPTAEDLDACRAFGERVAAALQEKLGAAEPDPTSSRTAPTPDVAGGEIDLQALFTITHGMYVVSACTADGAFNGQISDAVMQVTDTPNQVVATINTTELTYDCIVASGSFTVTVLSQTAPMEFIGRFGFQSGRDIAKYEGIGFAVAPTGCPYPTDHAVAYIDCKLVQTVDVGTHAMFVGEVVACRLLSRQPIMTYAHYREVLRGKTPPNAPTHDESEVEGPIQVHRAEPGEGSHVCNLCNWVYDPAKGLPEQDIEPGTPFTDLPDDFLCPVCKAPKSEFSPL